MTKNNSTPLISVLMSVYNESEEQIRESIESLINQSFSDFEVIIVLDNPDRKDYYLSIIDSFNDGRLKTLVNENNIGLALSMNKAAKVAKSDILARMDADDIAYPDRFEVEYNTLVNNNYDFVFSRFDYIDEFSHKVNKLCPRLWNDDEIEIGVLCHNIIHHPTVMMKRHIFEKVGGYRNFPCAQDSDLWYRLLLEKCRFHMIENKLLKYRINPNGTTQTKRYKQALTNLYINYLLIERLKTGVDSYSLENYSNFLSQYGYNDKDKNRSFNHYLQILVDSKKLSTIPKILSRMKVFLLSSYYRKNYMANKKKLKLFRNKDWN